MKFPRKLKIGPHNVKVVFKKQLSLGGKPCLGISDSDHLTIQLVKEYNGEVIPESKLWANLWHEILHHLLWVASIDLTEEEVTILGDQIYQVLADNNLEPYRTNKS